MAQVRSHPSTATLRAITYRLTSTPIKQLPYVVPQIAASLWSCRDVLSSAPESLKRTSEASVIVHRFKTQLSTLLQDRTIEGRWAAVVLVKAAIEAGGVETLSKSNAWVRNLLGVLKKPDPSSTRSLAIVALTRIFMLTWDYSNLVREITTPALPAFVSTCLNNVESSRCSPDELQTVLDAFATLIPRHPTIFRTNETQIRTLLVKILSQTSSESSDMHYTHDHQLGAQHLVVLLHHTAPKQGATDKWDENLRSTITSAHATCDHLFRSVVEDWQSAAGVRPSAQPSVLMQGDLDADGDVSLGLSSWKGPSAGSERLQATIGLMKVYLISSTAGPVNVRLGLVADLLARLFSLRQPDRRGDSVQANVQISREEREAMFHVLPEIHVAGMEVIEAMIHQFDQAAISVMQPLLSQVAWVFETESSDVALRTATYGVLRPILASQGHGFAKEDIADIESVVRACCQDLLPIEARTTSTSANASPMQQSSTANGDMVLQPFKAGARHVTEFPELVNAARDLLSTALATLNTKLQPKRLRQLMDFTATMTQDKAALVASVLNPSAVRGHSSLLPLLARHHPDSVEAEALLRPRMPPIRHERSGEKSEEADGYEEDDLNMMMDHQSEDNLTASVDAPDGVENNDTLTENQISAHDQHKQPYIQPASHDNLYLVSPPSHGDLTSNHSANKSLKKRDAPKEASAEPTPKRSRASPMAEALLPNPTASLSGADPATASSSVPITVVVDQQPKSSFVTASEPSQQSVTLPADTSGAATSASAVADLAGDVESDGSDFEMPPLTMESDTDSEDEADEDDEE